MSPLEASQIAANYSTVGGFGIQCAILLLTVLNFLLLQSQGLDKKWPY